MAGRSAGRVDSLAIAGRREGFRREWVAPPLRSVLTRVAGRGRVFVRLAVPKPSRRSYSRRAVARLAAHFPIKGNFFDFDRRFSERSSLNGYTDRFHKALRTTSFAKRL